MRKRSTRWLRLLLPFIAIIGFSGLTFAGNLEPSGPPASTMRTLEELTPAWNNKLPGAERFVNALDGGAVLDKETGLVWEKSPSIDTMTWLDTISSCYIKEVNNRKGWRLPTIDELASLVDNSNNDPSLPAAHPFQNVQSSGFYWSATTDAATADAGIISQAWFVNFFGGVVGTGFKTSVGHVWCVRGRP